MKRKAEWMRRIAAAGLLVPWVLLGIGLILLKNPWLLAAAAALFAAWGITLLVLQQEFCSACAKWVAVGLHHKENGLGVLLADLPQPTALLSDGALVWYNAGFARAFPSVKQPLPAQAERLLGGLDIKACLTEDGQLLRLNGHQWNVHGCTAEEAGETLCLLVFHEETALREVEQEYAASRPGYLIFSIDGYAEVFGDMLDSEKARLLEGVNRTLEKMIGSSTGFLRRVSRGRYIAVAEERHLEKFAQDRYHILDEIRALDESVNLTVSIGIGRGARTLREAQDMAVRALDMAQGRGGDQAAEMTRDGFTFYGGVSHAVERRSKVKSRRIAEALTAQIRASDRVIIMGHRMSDMDAVGASAGVLRICRWCGIPAVIAVRRDATLAASLIDALAAGGEGDFFVPPEAAEEMVTEQTLCIVVDTYQTALVESPALLRRCKRVAVIDHHRKGVGFIENPVLVCHEPYASSASELVTELLQYAGEQNDRPTRTEAEGLLAGIMLDTRGFSLHTGVRTFEAASVLRRWGAETADVKALFAVSHAEYTAKAGLVSAAEMYRGCAVSVSGELPPGARIAVPQAANDLLTISGVEASFVAVKSGTGVNISARSMGGINVQIIMESLGGGGHQTMAAAQMKDITPEEVRQRIFGAIDEYRAVQEKGVSHPGTHA